MNNTEMIKELRSLTQAGMKDCKESLEEANWDLQAAIDIVKKKGLNIVSGVSGKITSEGVIAISSKGRALSMVEVNCQTDFVANNDGFKSFAQFAADTCVNSIVLGNTFHEKDVEDERHLVIATTKENVVVRRWWIQEAASPMARVFQYLHSNAQIGVVLTLLAPSVEAANSPEFAALGNDLAMQVAAMNPLAVSVDRLSPPVFARQKAIFEAQLNDMKKPQAAWPKILDGKLNKWYTDVCLLNQESVVTPKTTINQVIKNTSAKLGGEITVVDFIRAQVGH